MSDRSDASPGLSLLTLWERMSPRPGGKSYFSWALGRRARYSGSIGPQVDELRPGFARVRMLDMPRVRNHLDSVHAVAIANLGEIASGLAVLSALPEDVRGILVRLDTAYVKKGRGRLTATCRCEVPPVAGPVERAVIADVHDDLNELVATVTATWRLDRGPARGGPAPGRPAGSP